MGICGNKNKGKNAPYIENYAKGDRVLVGCDDGTIFEHSIAEEKVVHTYDKKFNKGIYQMATTKDYKTLFVITDEEAFGEFDTVTHEQTNHFAIDSADMCLVTDDNKFLIIAKGGKNPKLEKWSLETKQVVHTWQTDLDFYLYS